MTNGSGILEEIKAKNMNKYLDLKNNECFNKNTVIMPYTPLRSTLK